MNSSQPPSLATWLLERWGSGPNREALAGDLIEQYQRGRPPGWYWRQVLRAILVGAVHDIRGHTLLAGRALVMFWTASFLLNWFTHALRQSLFDGWAQAPWTSEILRQVWVYYGVPFVIIMCLGFVVIGWMVATLHRDYRAAIVILCAMSQLPVVARWGWHTGRLLQAGLWPFWDYRLALLFHAAIGFIGYPICVLLGGLSGARPHADAPSRIPAY
jgi:hypothetical protein